MLCVAVDSYYDILVTVSNVLPSRVTGPLDSHIFQACGQYTGYVSPGQLIHIHCNPLIVWGQIVSIVSLLGQPLRLCEVEVFCYNGKSDNIT